MKGSFFMKKNIRILLILIIIMIVTMPFVKATTPSEELVSYIKGKQKKYISDADIVRIERYLKEYPVTAEECEKLKQKIDSAMAIVENSGVQDFKQISQTDKNKLKSIANEAATIVDVRLVFKEDSVEIYKNGKQVESVQFNSNKLSYTGRNNEFDKIETIAIAIFALAITGFSIRKNGNFIK